MYHATAVGGAVSAGGAQSGTRSVVLTSFNNSPSVLCHDRSSLCDFGARLGGRVRGRGQAAKSVRRRSPRDPDGRYRT